MPHLTEIKNTLPIFVTRMIEAIGLYAFPKKSVTALT